MWGMFKPIAPLVLLLAGAASAQTPAAAPTPAESKKSVEQRAERLVHSDSGSRVEELRVGGETRRIEVETRGALPGYQVAPQTGNQAPDSGLGERAGGAGRSSWRLLNF